MSDKPDKKTMSDAHNTHHAEKRRLRREQSNKSKSQKGAGSDKSWPSRPSVERDNTDRLFIYGLHTVRHAINNPDRKIMTLFATPNALSRLELTDEALSSLTIEDTPPRQLDKFVGSDAVHQGCVLEVKPLVCKSLQAISQSNLLLVLDQVTDPHNVGAIMRSALAMGAGALITTTRHSPTETGVMAKSASGALDMLDHIEVRNLGEALEELNTLGFQTIGLDSEGPEVLENSMNAKKIALVLGSEGKGLRQKTAQTCTTLARVDMPGPIKSLNVSNAAALSLYIVKQHLK